MKRYLGLKSKSLGGCRWPWPPGLGTDSFGLWNFVRHDRIVSVQI